MINLKDLLLSRVREILGIIAEGGVSHREVSSVARHVQADYHGRFLVELIQNANDQVVKAGQKDGTVEIYRTSNALAVGNVGLPFDDAGIRALTTLGLSEKDPNLLIGNKGIGFKAVFEVAESPEIYSAPPGGGNLIDDEATAFTISQNPFAGDDGAARLRALVERAVEEKPAESKKLGANAVEVLTEAVHEAAPFKFPIGISSESRTQRLAEFDFDLASISTLMVLPLRTSEKTESGVNRAMDEILESGGSFILFLPGVAKVRVTDSVRGLEFSITRTDEGQAEVMEGGEIYSVRRISTKESGEELAEKTWHVVQAMVGGDANSDAASALLDAARDLPGDGQSKVTQAPVAVALPEQSAGESLALGANGKFCIGLPTKVATGTPAWVHSHFFGKISRQDLDLDYLFNEILFDESIRLHQKLVGRLRQDQRFERRRLVTLAYEKGEGSLADRLFSDDGDAFGPVILADDGDSFVCPTEVLVPSPERVDIIGKILGSCPDGVFDLPRTPHQSLVTGAYELITKLTNSAGPVGREVFLLVDEEGRTPLEHAAEKNRLSGAGFWKDFLEYAMELTESDHTELLGPLRILPVGASRLAASLDGVFLQPATSVESAGDDVDEDEELEAPEVERTTLESLPKDVFDRLNFLDESQVRVRRENGRTLTGLASRLAPDKGKGLISRPRKVEMILGAIVPAIDELGSEPADLVYGLQLLKIAGQWMEDIGEDDSKKVHRQIRVPVEAGPGVWEWQPAGTSYFGKGWACEHEQLLMSAYGGLSGRLLISFERLEFTSGDKDVEMWRGVMANIGVNPRPRLIFPQRRGSAQFQAEHNKVLGIADEPICPIEEAEPFWRPYIEDCSGRVTSVGSRQNYRLSEISWIEGLEAEESRRPIVEMILRDHEQYSLHSKVLIGRKQNPETMDSSDHVSLWAFAIRNGNWQCIPGESGICRPSECWLIGVRSDSGQQGRFEYLKRVRKDVLPAKELLERFGVPDIQDPSPTPLLAELERCAQRLECGTAEQPLLHNLVDDLYERLQTVLTDTVNANGLTLSAARLPLLRSGRLVAISPSEMEVAYVNDEPERAAFLPELENSLIWPLPAKRKGGTEDGILVSIRRSFGERAALLVSEMEIQTGFEASQRPLSLRDWLRASGFSDPDSVMIDLACLLCMKPSEIIPDSERFNAVWEQFENIKLVRGVFPERTQVDHFLRAEDEERVLEISEDLDPFSVLQELWRLGGDRNLLGAYIGSARNGGIESFFRSRCFSGKEREDVEFAVAAVTGEQLEGIKAAIFAFRHREHGESVEAFLNLWTAKRDSWEEFIDWLGAPFTAELIEQALAAGNTESRSLEVLRMPGIGVAEWQDARRALGMEPHRFVGSERLWKVVCNQVVAILKAAVARRASVDFGYAKSTIEALSRLAIPEAVLQATPDTSQTLSVVVEKTEGLLTDEVSKARSVFERALHLMRSSPEITSASDVKVSEIAPARDVSEYRDNDEVERTRRAIEWCTGYLRIAARLTKTEEDIGAVMAEPELAPLISGYWANRFSMVPALQGVLEQRAPIALQEMKDRGAFRNSSDLQHLAGLFPELNSEKKKEIAPEADKPAPRKVEIMGVEVEEDSIFDELIGQGSLADALTTALDRETFDPVAIGDRDRVATPTVSQKKAARRRRSASDVRDSAELKNRIGQVGELYVYKWLQTFGLPAFDQECWISSNRCPFLACEDGDDSAGFDFQVKDEQGRLTQNLEEPNVLIEVKSTSAEDDGRFVLTAWEWQRAIRANKSDGEEYWIVVVEQALSSPHISQIVKDPYRLMTETKLRFDHDSLVVKVGAPLLEGVSL